MDPRAFRAPTVGPTAAEAVTPFACNPPLGVRHRTDGVLVEGQSITTSMQIIRCAEIAE